MTKFKKKIKELKNPKKKATTIYLTEQSQTILDNICKDEDCTRTVAIEALILNGGI